MSKSSTRVSLTGAFGRHLKSVDETYFQHMVHALSFTCALFLGAVMCLIHAFLPFLFAKSGSNIVTRLHDRMVINRMNLSSRNAEASLQAMHEPSEELRL
ncbi:MAG: DUF6356 family protein [Gammaproteobacteria bacterium]|nr:DUF6356 family protein [Gammaproteobacteria bacterium]MDD9894883.1 DUF6356 family protein [Gammaproteobacteria bacterium]MDD9958862.1 DUF6356 family protein [Gammaproteobacteria bacterium]